MIFSGTSFTKSKRTCLLTCDACDWNDNGNFKLVNTVNVICKEMVLADTHKRRMTYATGGCETVAKLKKWNPEDSWKSMGRWSGLSAYTQRLNMVNYVRFWKHDVAESIIWTEISLIPGFTCVPLLRRLGLVLGITSECLIYSSWRQMGSLAISCN